MGLLLDEEVYLAVASALRSDKHVILTGPPGTAKTTLAEVTARLARDAGLSNEPLLTTATADWTTYETIGGLRPKADGTGLEFKEGHFVSAARTGSWLIVDELNRSNFDRAFGQLFTILSGQSVVLPYEDPSSGRPIAVVLGEELHGYSAPDFSVVRIPKTWRIIATMNVFDKSLLFEMSFALMRRFAFIEVSAPPPERFEELWRPELLSLEEVDRERTSTVLKTLLQIRSVKDIGPAVFIDMARFSSEYVQEGASDHELGFQLFYSYLLPQFEGIDRRQGKALLNHLAPIVGKERLPRLRRTLRDVLGIDGSPR